MGQHHSCSSPAKQQSGSGTFVGGHGEAWPPVVGFTCQRWARLLSVNRPRVSSCNGPLTTSTPHHLSHTFPGRTRPKKEDWLKKKDRKQRRPGCRRKEEKGRASSSPGPLSFKRDSVLCPRDCSSSLALTL